MEGERTAGLSLLERATNYWLGSLNLVTPAALARPTPCDAWDLRALLRHVNDSLAALCEAVAIGRVDPDVAPDPAAPAPEAPEAVLTALRDNTCRLLGAWANARGVDVVSVAGRPLSADVVAGTGALEVAVHGWDVARACGSERPIPERLGAKLLELAPLIVTDADRPARFAPPVAVSPDAAAGVRLVAFLGRAPWR